MAYSDAQEKYDAALRSIYIYKPYAVSDNDQEILPRVRSEANKALEALGSKLRIPYSVTELTTVENAKLEAAANEKREKVNWMMTLAGLPETKFFTPETFSNYAKSDLTLEQIVGKEKTAYTQEVNQATKTYWANESEAFSRVMSAMENGTAQLKEVITGYDEWNRPISELALTTGEHPGYDTLYLKPTPREGVYQFSTPNQVAGGMIHGVIQADPKTGQYAPVQDYAKQIQYTPGQSGSFFGNLIGDFGDMYKSLGPIAPLIGNAIVPGLGSALSAVAALDEGNTTGAVLSALGGAEAYGGDAAANALAAEVSGNAALATQYSSGLSGTLAASMPEIKTATNAAQLANALDKGNILGAVNAGLNLTDTRLPKDVRTGLTTAALGQALAGGNVPQALALAGQLTKNEDVTLAAKAAKVVTALESGNKAAAGASLFDLGKSADKYLQTANSNAEAFEADINSALDSKTSFAQDTADATQQLIDAITNPQSTVSYPGTQLADVGKAGDPGSGVYWDSSIGAWRVADEPTAEDLDQLGVGLPTDTGPTYSLEELIAQGDTKAQEAGFPDYETQKLYRGDIDAYNRDVAHKAMLESMDPTERAYLNYRNQQEDGPGFTSFEDFKKYGGDYSAYQRDQIGDGVTDDGTTEDIQDIIDQQNKPSYSLEELIAQSDTKAQEAGFPDYKTQKLYGGDVDAYNRDVAHKAMLESMDPTERAYLNYRDQQEDGPGFTSFEDFEKYGGDYSAYQRDQIGDGVTDDGTTKDIQDIIDTTTGGSLGDESDLPSVDTGGSLGDESDLPITDTEEEPECAPGFHWNGSMCVADTDVDDETTTCPEGYIFDLDTQTCVPVGSTDTTKLPTDTTKLPTNTTKLPTDTTKLPTDTTKLPTDTTKKSTGLDLAGLLALMGGQQGETITPGVADMSGMVDIETLLANPLQTDYRKLANKPKMAEGGSIDDLLTLLNQKG